MAGFRNKKPKLGFDRPKAVGGQEVLRAWSTVKMSEIQVGDIIAGMGLVRTVQPTCRDEIYVEAGENTELFLPPDDEVLAFVKKGN